MNNKIKRYTDSQEFSVEFPALWEGRKENDIIIIYIPRNEEEIFTSNIVIKIDKLESNISLSDYNKLSLLQIMKLTDNKPSVSLYKDIKINKKESKLITYQINFNEQDLKICSVWFVVNSKAYTITYTSTPKKFNTYIKTVLQVFDSFQLT